jgi:hypothetical protein
MTMWQKIILAVTIAYLVWFWGYKVCETTKYMMENEHIILMQPWVVNYCPFVMKLFRTVTWYSYRDNKLIAQGRAFNYPEGENKAKEALRR